MTSRRVPERRGLAALIVIAAVWGAAATHATTREGYVDVGGGVRLHYVDAGDRGAPATIVLIPGWCMTTAVWRDQIAALAATARVIAIDPRSQGRSTVTAWSNTPEQRAQDLRHLMTALRLTRVVLVGWSQGVQAVIAYASAFQGADIAAYVLVDAPVSAGAAAVTAHPEELAAELERLSLYERQPREYLEGMMRAIIRSPQGRSRIGAYVDDALRTPPDLGITMLLMDFMTVDRRAALPGINRPTLVIAAAGSDELDAQREMASRIPGARLEIIDRAGHAVFLDQPGPFHDVLAEFVRQVAAVPAGQGRSAGSPDTLARATVPPTRS